MIPSDNIPREASPQTEDSKTEDRRLKTGKSEPTTMSLRFQESGCRDPFDDAVERLLHGIAEARDHTILNETLAIDPEARRRYVQAILFGACWRPNSPR